MTEYKVLKRIKVGSDWYLPGDTVEETPEHNWPRILSLGLVAQGDNKTEAKVGERAPEGFTPKAIKETPKEPAQEPKEDLTNLDLSANTKHEPVIKPAGKAWFKVYLGDEVLGKAVRTREEAQEIVDEWHEKNK